MENPKKDEVEQVSNVVRELLSHEERIKPDFQKYLEDNEFYGTPASSKYHGSHPGGLVLHSYNVYKRLCEYNEWQNLEIPHDSLLIMGLFHDVCKLNHYVIEMRNRKDKETGRWYEYPYYETEEQLPLEHGHKSALILMKHIGLSAKETLTVAWHMGAWDTEAYVARQKLSEAMRKCPWVLALQTADMQSVSIDNL